MKRRIFCSLLIILFFTVDAKAAPIQWAKFDVPLESLDYAMQCDIATAEQENHLSWIDILSVAGCRTGGKCGLPSVQKAQRELRNGLSPQESLGELYKYYPYYHQVYQAVLGGFLGNYRITTGDKCREIYGLKAFSPIAEGYEYSHWDDFGNTRTFGFKRKHLGNDLMGRQGTPIIAVESGVVEALGWNRYGGWRVGIRSCDSKRYYYYAHLQKDHPFAENIHLGDLVQAGDIIGFMGRTGYSDCENVNNIDKVHLHFGMELVFDESQKECNSEIWIDVYDLVQLLDRHRCTVVRNGTTWDRKFHFVDLDVSPLFQK